MTTTDKITEKFNTSQEALVLQQSDLSLKSIAEMVQAGYIDISPKYQRRERWTKDKESELIESFLLNIPVPPIYLAEDEKGTYSVIDGKQRVTAITRFLSNELKLQMLEKFTELEGFTFNQLPELLANALKIRPYLRVVTLLRQSDADLKHEVFLRLNKAGVALNSQEIRNVAFRGKFNDMIFDLSEEKYLREQLKSHPNSKTFKEMVDVQYVLRFFTVKEYWQNFPGNMDVAMDNFMRAHYKDSESLVTMAKDSFLQALEFTEVIWGDEGFMKPGGMKKVIQGFFDIQMVSSSLLNDSERNKAMSKPADVKRALHVLMTQEPYFADSVTQFTSNPRNVQHRIVKFYETLKNI